MSDSKREDYFHNDLQEFDKHAIAKVEELMEEEILPRVYAAIKQGRTREENGGKGSCLEVELNECDFKGKDYTNYI